MALKLVSILLAATALATLGAASPVSTRLTPEDHILFEPAEESAEEEGNAWEKSGFFEGDMVLDEKHFRNGRLSGFTGEPARFKSTTIPYEIDSHFDAEQKAAIQKAFEEYHKKSCIRFRRKVPKDRDWISIEPAGTDEGCYAQIGRIGGKQYVRLESSEIGFACFKHGTIVHELLHALGFYHQHCATNRDDYVTILWSNIKKGQQHNFQIHESTSFGVEYDYDSLMHYSPKAFSKNGKDTIIPKKPGVTIGQSEHLSPKDVKKLNIMYGCPASGRYSAESLTDSDPWLA